MGDVRLYASEKSASLTNFNVVYTHFAVRKRPTDVKMGRYKQDAEREENLREFTWRK